MFFIKILARFIAMLDSNSKPGAVAAAVATAFLLALVPSLNLLWLVLFIISLIVRLNWGFELVFIALFKWIVPLIDPLIEPMGWAVLQSELVSSLVYRINEVPGLIFLDLNDSLMISGLIVGAAAWGPVFFLVRIITVIFRKKISPKIANSKIMKAIKKVPVLGKLVSSVKEIREF